MSRLPEKYRTRLVFALAFAAVGAVFTAVYFVLYTGTLGEFGPTGVNVFTIIVISFGAFPAAWFSWPKHRPRTQKHMILAGLKTVLLAFTMLAFATPFAGVLLAGGTPTLLHIPNAILAIPVVVILGSILTLGLPYFIGVYVATHFADSVDQYLK